VAGTPSSESTVTSPQRLPTKHNDANPEAYLKGTLAKIAEGHPINRIHELRPWDWRTFKQAAAYSILGTRPRIAEAARSEDTGQAQPRNGHCPSCT
jgi:hypothetical protein